MEQTNYMTDFVLFGVLISWQKEAFEIMPLYATGQYYKKYRIVLYILNEYEDSCFVLQQTLDVYTQSWRTREIGHLAHI